MDTGVYEISVASKEIDFHDYAKKLALPEDLVDDIEEIKNGIVNLGRRCLIFTENEKKRTVLVQFKFRHHLNNTKTQFNIDEESDGTRRLVDLLPMLFTVDKNSKLYFVDEIDRSLHTKLSQFLLDEFARSAATSCNQIIFTAHDVNLINLDHFRQDEIWFIEKNCLGESCLKLFSDFDVKAETYQFSHYNVQNIKEAIQRASDLHTDKVLNILHLPCTYSCKK